MDAGLAGQASGEGLVGWAAALLLLLSMVLGGGGSPAPIPEIVLQLAAAVVALGVVASPRSWQSLRSAPRRAWVIAGLIALVPVLQLIPLPSGLWQALPGRANQVAALELVDADGGWRAITLSPARTLSSLLVALSAGLMLVLTAALDPRGRARLIAVLALVGAMTLLVGAAQLSGGTASALRFYDPEQIHLTGFQANHNSTADVILIAMVAVAVPARHWLDRSGRGLPRWQLAAAAIVIDGVLVLGLFLAGSRAGLALLPVALLFQYLILRPGRGIGWTRLALSSLVAGTAAAAALLLLRGNPAVQAVIGRFRFAGEFRPELWRDSLFALKQTWPYGSGQGTFMPQLIAVERLEVVDPTLPNRAHNDFLELALEGGLPALLVLVAIVLLLLGAFRRSLRMAGPQVRPQVLFGGGVMVIIALHSLVDYPLRSMALAAAAATAAGLLIPVRPKQTQQAKGSLP